MNDDAIVTDQLTKHYGDIEAVNDLELRVLRGEVFGFLGPNGAGKTTTIRVLLGLLRPTRGRALILGRDVAADGPAVRASASYLPSEDALYEYMTGDEYLRSFERLGGRPAERRAELVERLDANTSQPLKSLSSGNRRKVAIIRALQVDVPVYLLDEPTRGLDPLVQQEFGRIVRESRDAGRTVFLSTHTLSEAEALCDRVAILRKGSLATVQSVAALLADRLRHFTVRFGGGPPDELSLPGVTVINRDDHQLEFEVSGPIDPIIKALAHYEVVDLTTEEPTLEEVFLQYYGKRIAA